MAEMHADLVILGSGSTAFAAALNAAEMGKTAIMTENWQVGGTCVNRGCLPSKNLIEAAKLVYDAANPRYPGLNGSPIKVDFPALVGQKDAVIDCYRQKKYLSLADGADTITIREGDVRFLDSHTLAVGDERVTGEQFLIALGSHPTMAMELKELPASLLILGGGYIALELGQLFSRLGTNVTLIVRSPQLLAHGYEPEVGKAIGEAFAEEGIRVLTRTDVRAVREEGNGIVATISVRGQERELRAQRLVVATGRAPNTTGIGLEEIGVALNNHGAVKADEHLRTNVPHIWAAGDIIGTETDSQMATPVGAHDGGIAARNALSGDSLKSVDHRVIPRAIFTDPQIGIVGMTDAEAIAAGYDCWCNTVPMEYVPRAGAIRDTRGVIKMVADARTNEVLGVSMVGVNAGEVIHEAAMGMRFHATLDDYIDLLHVYPTMAEALKVVAISRYKDPAKLSCCAE
ncbi:MAG: FAD-dependent oxidoreductase [Thermomicrobia bacterium]|nr:FAD-dependent oxidoreductase [Thermomicrobia bacterium]